VRSLVVAGTVVAALAGGGAVVASGRNGGNGGDAGSGAPACAPIVDATLRGVAMRIYALRAAIVRFFRTPSLHVVRVRATTADGRLVGDVGGPFVLAPASTVVREPDGRVVGRVTLSVQDDTGYMKLIRRFTGFGVIMRTATGDVPGSSPAGGDPPTFGFTATASPDGALNVGLVSPATARAGARRPRTSARPRRAASRCTGEARARPASG
jgi:hypothetical protein